MRKHWARLTAVIVALTMLQCCVFPGMAFGEHRIQENTVTKETAAPGQETTAPEAQDGSVRQSSYVFRPKVCSADAGGVRWPIS